MSELNPDNQQPIIVRSVTNGVSYKWLLQTLNVMVVAVGVSLLGAFLAMGSKWTGRVETRFDAQLKALSGLAVEIKGLAVQMDERTKRFDSFEKKIERIDEQLAKLLNKAAP